MLLVCSLAHVALSLQILKDWVFNKGAVEDTARLSMVKAYAMLQDGDVAQATHHTDNAVNQTLQR